MSEKWQRLSREEKFKNPWWTYRFEKLVRPNGTQGEYHYLHTQAGCSLIVPVTDSGTILFVKQYRYLFNESFIEFPAGGIESNEDKDQAARRELIEETGHDGQLEYIGNFMPLKGLSDEIAYIFLATDLRPSKEFSPDEEEELELIELTPEQINERIISNSFKDGMTIAAWSLVKPHVIDHINNPR